MDDLKYTTGEGGGGKSGGGGRVAQEADNTLRSAAVVKVVEVLSEGPIVGIAGGSRGILINNTPLTNSDSTYNFPRVIWDYRVGLPAQDYMPGFTFASAEYAVNAPVVAATPAVHTMNSSDIDSARVTIQLPNGLANQNTSNGDISGSDVSFRIDTKLTSSGNWQTFGTYTISGKTMSTYESSYLVTRPTASGVWDVRVVRLTADSSLSSLRNSTTFSRVTEIQSAKLSYPDTAVVGIAIDAESVGASIPTRSYMIKGKIISVPSNYDPETRIYSGVWDGLFKQAWSNNPAWILYDLLTHPRYGLGEFIGQSDIDIYSFYDASVYNDQLVPDGNGGTEPRFTFDTVLQSQEDAGKLLQLVAGAFRSRLLEINGKWTVLQDRPSSPVRDITNSNVVDGIFTYASSGLFERHTAFNVTYNNKFDRYLQKTTTLEDSTGILRYGYFPTDIAAYGATTEGQALRGGKWALDTELTTPEYVSFSMSRNGFDLLPNDIVYIYDTDYTQLAGEGRIVSVTGTQVKLDRQIQLTAGSKISVMLADGVTRQERAINQTAGLLDTVTIASAFSQNVIENSVYVLQTIVAPRQFKLMNFTFDTEADTVKIDGTYHDPSKYSRIELGINIPAPVFSTVGSTSSSTVFPPTNLVFTEQATKNADGSISRFLLVNWTKNTVGSPATSYKVFYNRDKSDVQIITAGSTGASIPLDSEGTYSVTVIAYDGAGRASGTPLSGSYVFTATVAGMLNAVQALFVKGTSGLSWTDDLVITWIPNGADVSAAQDYKVTIALPGGTVLRTEYVKTTEYAYSLAQNRADNFSAGRGPQGTLVITVTPRDLFSRLGTSNTVTFTNPPPAAPTLVVNAGNANVSITVSKCLESDYAGTMIFASPIALFTPSDSNKICDGTFFVHPTTVTMYYVAAHYDNYGKTGLNYSSVSAASPSASIGISLQYSVDGTTGWHSTYTAGDMYLRQRVDAGDWSDPILFVGGPGAAGATGDSQRKCYSKTTLTALSPTPTTITVTGGTAFPPDDSWGDGNVWSDVPPTLAAGESQYQSDGIYSVAANRTVWGKPYLSSLKVATLSAITVNTGNLTAQQITVDNTGWIAGGMTGFGVGSGFWQGYDNGAYKWFVGSTSGQYMSFNGSTLEINSANLILDSTGLTINGKGNFSGSLNVNNKFIVDNLGNMSAYSGVYGGTLLAGVIDFSSFQGVSYQYLTPGTYTITVPADKTSMRVRLAGGGGGGGASADLGGSASYRSSGSGGGGVKQSIATFNGMPAGATLTIVVGAGGAGGVYKEGTGQTGGSSYVAGYIGVAGGGGGEGGHQNRNPTSSGAGSNGGGAGQVGTGEYYTQTGTAPFIKSTYHPGEGAGGTGDVLGGSGSFNGAWMNGLGNSVNGQAGGNGFVIVEFFNPNAVVLRTDYNNLLTRLTTQLGFNATGL